MTVLVDSGGANIGSVQHALRRLGVEAPLTRDAGLIASAERVILPGVGAAAWAMNTLRQSGLDALIPKLTQPVLGICLGMQLMCEHSEEGEVDCLGLFGLKVRRFAPAPQRRVPHMGWNRLIRTADHPLLHGMGENDYAYFVHSFYVPESEHTLAACDYHGRFAAAIGRENFMAAQFHPERSATVGARILKNFLQIRA